MVAHAADLDADLFQDLPRDRFLQAFARFDEAGQGRIHRPGVAPVVRQDATVALMHQHDDGRIGARKVRNLAVRVDTDPDMTGVGRVGRAAAAGAERVAVVPMDKTLGVGKQGAFGLAQPAADVAQPDERAVRDNCFRIFDMRQVDREIGRPVLFAKQNQGCLVVRQLRGGRNRQPGDLRRLVALIQKRDEVLVTPHRQHPRTWRCLLIGDPRGIPALRTHAIDVGAGVEVDPVHVGLNPLPVYAAAPHP